MTTVMLLTNSYPFGSGEPYLEPELQNIPDEMHLVILPLHEENSSTCRFIPPNAELLFVPYASGNAFRKLRSLFTNAFRAGVKELRSNRKYSVKTLVELWRFVYSADMIQERIEKALFERSIPIDTDTVLYSYWMDSASLAAVQLKKYGAMAICRAHGADLYDERTTWGHQFLRGYLAEKMDQVYAVSEVGKRYLQKRVVQQEKISCAHLGVTDHGEAPFVSDGVLRIVSCSAVIPLKRLNLIVRALSQLRFPFFWTHIGGGPELAQITAMASESLPDSSFCFLGPMTNEEVHHYYQTTSVSVFVNASETEGLPVSIMEAISYGIPVIATDVGGTKEIVYDNEVGFLVKNDYALEGILQNIYKIYSMRYEDYLQLRENARKLFLEEWNARDVFRRFYDNLQ